MKTAEESTIENETIPCSGGECVGNPFEPESEIEPDSDEMEELRFQEENRYASIKNLTYDLRVHMQAQVKAAREEIKHSNHCNSIIPTLNLALSTLVGDDESAYFEPTTETATPTIIVGGNITSQSLFRIREVFGDFLLRPALGINSYLELQVFEYTPIPEEEEGVFGGTSNGSCDL